MLSTDRAMMFGFGGSILLWENLEDRAWFQHNGALGSESLRWVPYFKAESSYLLPSFLKR